MSGGGFGPPGGGGFGPPGDGGFGPPGGAPPGGFGTPPGPPGGGGFGPPGGGEASEAPAGRIPFTPEDETNIRQAALFMKISGALALFGVFFGFVGSVAVNLYTNLPAWGSVCTAAISILVQGGLAAMLFFSANAFGKIVDTDGQDQHHLADGLKKLRVYFLTKAVLWVLGILACCVGFGLVMVMGAAITAAFAGMGG
ncbi:MAG: hypothetical protein AB8I08_21645 [Sandaracinaceae bacterium]